ncbi:hypothetical protein HA466_0008950 [Hirschfeldia incana]|nr:hypothetical protein HA466_0008950 [Hirschfeldia incana]
MTGTASILRRRCDRKTSFRRKHIRRLRAFGTKDHPQKRNRATTKAGGTRLDKSPLSGVKADDDELGHGTRLPPETGEDDDTGFDECIVPSDINYITDDDIKEIVSHVPKGCSFTFVSDSCHSGGLIDSAEEQIGESFKKKPNKKFKCPFGLFCSKGNRFLPLQTSINMLKQATGRDDIEEGNIRTTLLDLFGEDASPKVKKFMKVILSNMQESTEYLKPAMETQVKSKKEVYAGAINGGLGSNGILLSGCQTNQVSADVGSKDKAYGAFTNSLQIILAETKGKISYKELVLKSRKYLEKQGYP